MKKAFIIIIASAFAVTAAFASPVSAGEWKTINGRRFYNTGYETDYNGWKWLIKDGMPCYCYYFENGYAVTNGKTPDGYDVDEDGVWVENGQHVSRRVDFETMGKVTDFIKFGGSYSVTKAKLADGTESTYEKGAFPIRLDSDRDGFTLVWTGSGHPDQRYYNPNSEYSFQCNDGTLMDVMDEDHFRIIMTDGTEYTAER